MRKLLVLALLTACSQQPAVVSVPPHEDFIAGPQGRLHVSDGGGGKLLPVLFVHGNGANLTQWSAQLDHLRATRRAVAFDLPGMGKSEVPANGDYSIKAMEEDVDAVANALRLTRFVIVGHSYGGAVVAGYAAAHPERVAGVVYADSAGTINMPAAAAENFVAALKRDRDAVVSQWFGPMLKNAAPPVKSAVLASVQSTPLDAFTGALLGLRDVDVTAAARAYHGPRLIIAAGPGNPSALRTQVPEIPVREMTGVSHWLMMDKPGEFNALLDAFLVGVR